LISLKGTGTRGYSFNWSIFDALSADLKFRANTKRLCNKTPVINRFTDIDLSAPIEHHSTDTCTSILRVQTYALDIFKPFYLQCGSDANDIIFKIHIDKIVTRLNFQLQQQLHFSEQSYINTLKPNGNYMCQLV
jgi:hypothetical protein